MGAGPGFVRRWLKCERRAHARRIIRGTSETALRRLPAPAGHLQQNLSDSFSGEENSRSGVCSDGSQILSAADHCRRTLDGLVDCLVGNLKASSLRDVSGSAGFAAIHITQA